MLNAELEKEYSPSCWTKRFASSNEVLSHHIQFITTASDSARKEIPNQLNVKYGDAEAENYDIYGTKLPDTSPIFVYIHGGFWQELSKELSAYCVQPLVRAGVRVIILEYELCPKISLVNLVRQIQKAGLHILKYAGLRGSNVSFGGHSAGAHLAIAMLTQAFLTNAAENAKLINSVFLISGCYDLHDLRFTEAVNKNNILSLTDDNVRQLSPVYHSFGHLQSLATQFIVLVAEHDSATFKKQSQAIFEKLKGSNLSVDYQLLPELDHFDIVERLSLDDYEITKNIISKLKP